jgi:hypothetical protein
MELPSAVDEKKHSSGGGKYELLNFEQLKCKKFSPNIN